MLIHEIQRKKKRSFQNSFIFVCVKQGSQSLGIMIIEGKHTEVGQGIFISDIQEGSSAQKVNKISSRPFSQYL